MMMRRGTIDLLLLLLNLSRRNIFTGSRRRNPLAARCRNRVLRVARGRAARGVHRRGASTAAGEQVGAIAIARRRSSNFEISDTPVMICGSERWLISLNLHGNGRIICAGFGAR